MVYYKRVILQHHRPHQQPFCLVAPLSARLFQTKNNAAEVDGHSIFSVSASKKAHCCLQIVFSYRLYQPKGHRNNAVEALTIRFD